jgi:hypothetical protein
MFDKILFPCLICAAISLALSLIVILCPNPFRKVRDTIVTDDSVEVFEDENHTVIRINKNGTID